MQFPVERSIRAEPGQVIASLEELVRTLANRVCQPAGAPFLFVGYITIAVANEVFDPSPGIRGLVLIQHWAKDNNEFVVIQIKLRNIPRIIEIIASGIEWLN